MKWKNKSVRELADIVCGNYPDKLFPYRSRTSITLFFKDCELDQKSAVESEVLKILREHLLDPTRMRGEIRRVETLLKEREKDEAEEVRRLVDGSELRRIESEMAAITKLKLSAGDKGRRHECAAGREGKLGKYCPP